MEARARREAVEAEEAELRLEERRGRLISATEVIEVQESMAREIRDHILLFPARAAGELVRVPAGDEHAMMTTLDQLLREHLMEKSDSLALTA